MGTKPCTATVFVAGPEGTDVVNMSWGSGFAGYHGLLDQGFTLDAAVELFHAASGCTH